MKNINVIFPAKLGDWLTLTPVLKVLNDNWYKINLFCSEYNKIIFENNPYISNLISLPWHIFRNFRFPVLPKLWSIVQLIFFQMWKFKEFRDLSTFVINENIQSYIFGRVISENVFYKDPVYHFLWGKEIYTNKNQLFSYQILEFFQKSLWNLKVDKESFCYQIFWKEINLAQILNKFSKKLEKNNLRDLVLFNLWATLEIKELSIEENINFINKFLNKWNLILIFDKSLKTEKLDKIKNIFKTNKNVLFLKEQLNLKEFFTLSKYCKEYYGPDGGLSHLISINCKSHIFFTKNNRVEKVWLPLQNTEAIIL